MTTTHPTERRAGDPDAAEPAPPARPLPAQLGAILTRVHFYAGLFVAPFLLIVALSGALYAMSPTLERLVYTDQLTALDDGLGERADRRVILLGHHQQWIGTNRSPDYFGLDPDASDALDALCVRHPNVVAYAAGHTHRHRRRTMTASGATSIEVGCVKDFPGTWAEYRVFEGGVLQVVHRISSPEALSWSNRCRVLYSDFGVDYQAYAFGDLADRCFALADR